MTVNIISNTNTIKTPTVNLVINNVLKTYGSFNITTNMLGTFYY